MRNLNNIDGLISLDEDQLKETNGGILPVILLAVEVWVAVCAVAYAVGYTVGTIKENL